ncbi:MULTISPECIES: hypothetical protein [unclassified Streptomyces]|uniref:hypothetical protein n=1 Tax=unclassified Streptomyces TaxID=2593676 RepID=UPI000DAB4F5C|nr:MULTISPECIES: hypothetical protein [unclassified Streptomyces]PZT72730.1 hypothetical protein DNK55_30050 [Streptomyces sp. AC1-42T]PZT80951.1 hypothetical protein DNK56_01520 [Streptomyces sp. AC1-42W]
MDAITAAALTAMAGSVGGDAGRQAWQGLTALVRRPFRRASPEDGDSATDSGISSGEREPAELERDPADPLRAQALATALGVRAALDGEFRALLDTWWREARSGTGGDVSNNVSGGTHNAPLLQGRDFSQITFNLPEREDDR